jgi:putative transposase
VISVRLWRPCWARRTRVTASTISRLKEVWSEELKEWQQRSLKGKEYVYLWVDGIHFGARMEDASQCMLVIIGATKSGDKELLSIVDGYRESEQSWLEALNDLKIKRRWLKAANKRTLPSFVSIHNI